MQNNTKIAGYPLLYSNSENNNNNNKRCIARGNKFLPVAEKIEEQPLVQLNLRFICSFFFYTSRKNLNIRRYMEFPSWLSGNESE